MLRMYDQCKRSSIFFPDASKHTSFLASTLHWTASYQVYLEEKNKVFQKTSVEKINWKQIVRLRGPCNLFTATNSDPRKSCLQIYYDCRLKWTGALSCWNQMWRWLGIVVQWTSFFLEEYNINATIKSFFNLPTKYTFCYNGITPDKCNFALWCICICSSTQVCNMHVLNFRHIF